jgi:hypothetical protein
MARWFRNRIVPFAERELYGVKDAGKPEYRWNQQTNRLKVVVIAANIEQVQCGRRDFVSFVISGGCVSDGRTPARAAR